MAEKDHRPVIQRELEAMRLMASAQGSIGAVMGEMAEAFPKVAPESLLTPQEVGLEITNGAIAAAVTFFVGICPTGEHLLPRDVILIFRAAIERYAEAAIKERAGAPP